jgi:ornithine cyclodeaminase
LSLLGIFAELRVFDLSSERAQQFLAQQALLVPKARTASSLADALQGADVALFATTSSTPYVKDEALLKDCRLILHVSLRDIDAKVLGSCVNVTDDREHVLRENTSLHRLAVSNPDREAVDADLGDVIWGTAVIPDDRVIAFSPFGLGVLDVALASSVLHDAARDGGTTQINRFFHSEN